LPWAAVEYLHARVRAKTLFATHYFELTELAEQLSGVKNYRVSVKEDWGRELYSCAGWNPAGGSQLRIEVAKLAGLPNEVILRARRCWLSTSSRSNRRPRIFRREHRRGATPPATQLTIFTPLSQPVLEKLAGSGFEPADTA